MWSEFRDVVFDVDIWIGVVASFIIPFTSTRLIQALRDWGNPPWLKKQQKPYYSTKPVQSQPNERQAKSPPD